MNAKSQPKSRDMPDLAMDYDALMQANLTRVFGERDADKRIEAIRQIYTEDAVLYEPDSSAKGPAAICQAVSKLLDSLPPNFVFTAVGPAVGHHGLGRLKWRSGPPDGPAAVTGTDVAKVEGDRISALYVFLDPASR